MPDRAPPKYRVFVSGAHRRQAAPAPGIDYVVDETLGYAAMVTSRLIQRILAARFRKHGVLFGEWPILLFLWARGTASQYELSRLISVGEGSIARAVARMERKALVTRQRNESDRRQYIVQPTAEGWSLRDALLDDVADLNRHIADALGAERAAMLLGMHRTLQTDLLALLDGAEPDETDL